MAKPLHFSFALLRAATLSAAALVLAACSALPTPPIQPVRYDLGMTDTAAPQANAAAPSVAPPPLVLAEVQTPAGADNSTAMLYRLAYANQQEQRAYQGARWSLPPAQMLEQRLRTRLALERPVLTDKDNVSPNASDQRPLGMLRLEVVEFNQVFESAQSSQAVVRLRASLIAQDSRGGNVLLGQQLFSAQAPATTADAAGGARAMSASVNDVATQLSNWLQRYGR
ncbi:PqiC family protein [Comamonas sp. Y33R10-2]|uniref:ABC-type transport auxiliary lipoprotein family protein n=1 Tax=Comamonas sp. Y33R10-2 TaxID=2853257 RepID=UPI001C5CB2FB|nr:ABC-type transport auxiliary lipoprotein family protein [Comamonas sp. Y33R10-2]QXZ08892.1 PqiC family protein [Comamonas sp. Y33R10-2]